MKPILKSQINLSEFFSFLMISGVVFLIIWISTNNIYISYAIIIVFPTLLYVAMFLWVNQYFFYDDCFQVVYLFRFTNRIKKYKYSDVEVAKYMNNGGKGNRAWIVLVFKGKSFSKVFRSYNSFSHYSFNKRKELFLLLKHKGVPVKVNSIFKKDKSILA